MYYFVQDAYKKYSAYILVAIIMGLIISASFPIQNNGSILGTFLKLAIMPFIYTNMVHRIKIFFSKDGEGILEQGFLQAYFSFYVVTLMVVFGLGGLMEHGIASLVYGVTGLLGVYLIIA